MRQYGSTTDCYLVKKEYDEANHRVSSSFLRTDGPVRVNKFGVVNLDCAFANREFRKDYYLIYIYEGRLGLRLGEETYSLTAGDVLIYPPGYRFDYGNSENLKISYYYSHFSGTDVERLMKAFGFTSLPAVFRPGVMESVVREFENFFTLFNARVKFIDEIASSTLVNVLTMIASKLNGQSEILPPWNAVNYVNRNLDRPIRVGELAKLEHMSESRFYTVFRREVGMSPVEYINSLRIERAANLLERLSIAIADVGRMVGFPDVCFFSKEFKKRCGMSPGEYRKRFGL